MATSSEALLTASVGAVAVYALYKCLQVQPFIPTLKISRHLHQPLLGILLRFNSLEDQGLIMFDEADDDGMVQFFIAGTPCVSVLNAQHIRQVLLASNYRAKNGLFDSANEAFLGKNALTQLMGRPWKIHRQLIAKAFGWQNLVAMVPAIHSIAIHFADRLIKESTADIVPLVKLAILDAIGACAFGQSFDALDDPSNPIVDAFTFLLDDLNRRTHEDVLNPANMFHWLPTDNNKKFHAKTKILREAIDALVASRLSKTSASHHDLLQFMIDAVTEEESGVTPQSFSDNLLTFLFAGFDTTSITLAYAFYLLAIHPDVQDKALAEVRQVVGSSDITYEMAQNLPFCTAIIMESLRLFPPAFLTVRTLESNMTIGRHDVPAGTTVMLPIYWIHRYAPNWGPDAEAFRPEWHLEDDDGVNLGAKEKGFRMLAFSGGPRNCVGMRFAMLEAVIVLATLLSKCEFQRPDDAPPVRAVMSGFLQKPEHGLWLNVTAREKIANAA
ncbi:hypothetical protein LEN26_013181 [Aphanomyces euteiches]|nr:hypothetical protein LEN26_013181 [Aphanomyces euteiches]KAH9121190.1 hypothetical protein AeMF1_006983 [Aphanomyces euteiches]KAH9167955.1 hypothetical protein AeNC1_018032 [Aphanomyces euteiches]